MDTPLSSIERTEELTQYENWINDLAASDSSTLVFNDGHEHAAILFGTIFRTAKKRICIYCDNMCGIVTGTTDYYNALAECKKRGVKVNVLLNSLETDVLRQPVFNLIDKQNEVKLVPAGKEDYIQTKLNNLNVHFTVADGKIYRIEYDIENFKAIASFNDEKMGDTLTNVFDEVWNAA